MLACCAHSLMLVVTVFPLQFACGSFVKSEGSGGRLGKNNFRGDSRWVGISKVCFFLSGEGVVCGLRGMLVHRADCARKADIFSGCLVVVFDCDLVFHFSHFSPWSVGVGGRRFHSPSLWRLSAHK